ncbi:hypothetical protein [Hymenobacter sp. IS2118]|uniref:hypothetical protein n=1 Tax=Hymenobacter sp. IS2118 TaxID=1505605 RepID=UPI001268867B|nr:hypothetical protein [Hymenobacter sp. IS2118]
MTNFFSLLTSGCAAAYDGGCALAKAKNCGTIEWSAVVQVRIIAPRKVPLLLFWSYPPKAAGRLSFFGRLLGLLKRPALAFSALQVVALSLKSACG